MTLRVCSCGKCDVRCDRHGQKGTCDECGKVRLLGTEAYGEVIRYICNPCCDRLSEASIKKQKDDFDRYMDELSSELSSQTMQKVSDQVAREQKNERVIEKKKGTSHEVDFKAHGLKTIKRKPKKPTDS